MNRFTRPVARRRALLDARPGVPILVRGASGTGASPNFVYLTGLIEPRAVLLLAPGGARIGLGRAHPGRDYLRGRLAGELLFLPRRDPLAAAWGEDASVTVESADAREIGVDAVLDLAALDEVLSRLAAGVSSLAIVRAAAPTLGGADDPDSLFAERLRRRFFGLTLHDLTPVVHEMRRTKDDEEVSAIERAAAVVAEAFDAAASCVRPGVAERAVEAEIARVYRRHGATHAFEPIVAAGANALKLHYSENSGELDRSALVLIDTGAALGGYRADVTRTLPIAGRFTPRQREIYDAVLAAWQCAIDAARPGAALGDVHATAFDALDRAGLAAHFPHGTSHHIGIETHDVGDLHRPLAAGCVITVEPGVYIAAEGIGVRIEDDVLITPSGPRVLTEAIPRDADAIERWLGERRP